MDLKRVTPSEAKKLVDEDDYLLLDVRAIPEYEDNRAHGAYNVPFLHKTPQGMVPNPDFEKVVAALAPDKTKGMVTHCAMGGRSLRAAQALKALGYENVVDMRGGFSSEKSDAGEVLAEGWLDSGLPTESGPGSPRGYSAVVGATGTDAEVPEAEPLPPLAGDPTNRFASDKRRVRCIKYKRELPGLKRRPYPGRLGERLFEDVSALAWNDWVEHSKMIINEYRVVSTDPKAMQLLYEQCEAFFYGPGVERPAEYVPE
jgi:Fe-S cluster biosynthesis and repair protein YggX/rhodanese-related sulfurtransferase